MDRAFHHAGHNFTVEQGVWMRKNGFTFFTDMDSWGTEGFQGPKGSARFCKDSKYHTSKCTGVDPRSGLRTYDQRTFTTIREAIVWCLGD